MTNRWAPRLLWLPVAVIALGLAMSAVGALGGGVALAAGAGQRAQSAAHSTSARTTTMGVIRGQVLNGSQNNAVVAGQRVILQLSVGATTHDLQTVKTDSQGQFTFTQVDPTTDASVNYAVYTQYQGGVYSTNPIQVKAGQTQQTQLVVYTATQDSANLSVSVVTILFRDIDQQHALHGLVSVGEFVTVQNSGKTAFVGSFAQPAGGGMPGALRFALPSNATNLVTGVGFFNTQIIQLNGGFAATATVPPGQTQFAFSFDTPYTGTAFTLPYTAQYATTQVVALVPPDMSVRPTSGVQSQGPVEAFSSRFNVYTANKLAAQQQVTFSLFNLPQAGEQSDLDFTQLVWLAVGLAMIIAILLVFYLRRGDLAVALGLVPARAMKAERMSQAAAKRMNTTERDAERRRLLRRLLTLEKAYTSGALADTAYRQQRAETRAALKAVLAADQPAARRTPTSAATPTTRAAQAGQTPQAEALAVAPSTSEAATHTPTTVNAEAGATPDATDTPAQVVASIEDGAPSASANVDDGASANGAHAAKPARRAPVVASAIGKRAAKSAPNRVLSGGHR